MSRLSLSSCSTLTSVAWLRGGGGVEGVEGGFDVIGGVEEIQDEKVFRLLASLGAERFSRDNACTTCTPSQALVDVHGAELGLVEPVGICCTTRNAVFVHIEIAGKLVADVLGVGGFCRVEMGGQVVDVSSVYL